MADTRRTYDDDADLDISLKPESSSRAGWLVLASMGLFLLICVGGVSIVVMMLNSREDQSKKLPGNWKGQFIFADQRIDSVYIFQQNGNFREESHDQVTGRRNVSTGRWHLDGQTIQIDWDNGSFEDARVTWLDDHTIRYQIVDHNDAQQIGLVTTLRRQR